ALAQAAGAGRPRAEGASGTGTRPAKAPNSRGPARGRSAGGRGPSYPKAGPALGAGQGRSAGGRKEKTADRQPGGQPDPMKTAFGYIGADSFSRQRQDGAGRPRGGQGGQRRGGRNR
ncbi:MAG: 23S rRNA pseudouridylate synthase B, partial [Rhodoferax sp.]